jgi:hypothetical protein
MSCNMRPLRSTEKASDRLLGDRGGAPGLSISHRWASWRDCRARLVRSGQFSWAVRSFSGSLVNTPGTLRSTPRSVVTTIPTNARQEHHHAKTSDEGHGIKRLARPHVPLRRRTGLEAFSSRPISGSKVISVTHKPAWISHHHGQNRRPARCIKTSLPIRRRLMISGMGYVDICPVSSRPKSFHFVPNCGAYSTLDFSGHQHIVNERLIARGG